MDENVFSKFAHAGEDLFWNAWNAVTGGAVDWTATRVFWHDVFFPWMVGGLVPGIFVGLACYTISLPLITAYQRRRRGALKKKLEDIRRKAAEQAATRKAAKAKAGGGAG